MLRCFRGWQTPVLDLRSSREEVFTDDPARPTGSRREDRGLIAFGDVIRFAFLSSGVFRFVATWHHHSPPI
jgi:hypothetical protein